MINAIITDFDGTLVDTFEANYNAYEKAFAKNGLQLSREIYRVCFGLRFDAFMEKVNISDNNTQMRIKEIKMSCYPSFFYMLKVNKALLEFISSFHKAGGKTAIASTARAENLFRVISYLKMEDFFDVILSGDDVMNGKPAPEIYNKTMKMLGETPDKTLIFEDSQSGIIAASLSGAHCVRIDENWFQYQ